LWKLILEPNPVIREFFDLGPPKPSRATTTTVHHVQADRRPRDISNNNLRTSTIRRGRGI